MQLGTLLESLEAERRRNGTRFNTLVCRPQDLAAWRHVSPEALRLIFAEHGLRLQVDPASPWTSVSALWIEPATADAAA